MTGRSPDDRSDGNRRPDRVLFPSDEGAPDPGSSCQARDNAWTQEEYLAAVLSREVAAREASGAEARARAAGFPARKSLEDFSFDHQPGLKSDIIAHLSTGAFLTEASNIVLLGPPGTGNTHPCNRAWAAGHAAGPSGLVRDRHRLGRPAPGCVAGRLPQVLVRLRRYGLIVVFGYIPFEQDAANLFFHLVSSRYKHASWVLTSNLPFACWGDVFGDQVVASAMIDRIVHYAEVVTLKGSSYRLKHTRADSPPSTRAENTAEYPTSTWLTFQPDGSVFDHR
jgi:DNA replication protein DnaC